MHCCVSNSKWLHERTTMLCYTYLAYLVSYLSIDWNISKNASTVSSLQNFWFWQTLVSEGGVIIMNLYYKIQFFLNCFKNTFLFQKVNSSPLIRWTLSIAPFSFWTLTMVQCLKWNDWIHFGDRLCLHPQVKGVKEAPTQLGPIDTFILTSSPEVMNSLLVRPKYYVGAFSASLLPEDGDTSYLQNLFNSCLSKTLC
jgi:hypothetical protein